MNILIGGDFFPGRSLEQMAIRAPKLLWGDILPFMAKADLRIVNLECPLTLTNKGINKTGPNLKAHPETIHALKVADIDLVSLANNHIYDYGQRGLEDTLEICQEKGIATVGAGLNVKQARTTWSRHIKGRTLAVVNFSENEWCNAGDTRGGGNSYDLIENVRQIQLAREQADIVLVIIHGGHEYCHYPSPRMVKEYRFFAEQGASAVVGHHTHCVSGFEVHEGVPIFYSLGNLLFDADKQVPGWSKGFLLDLLFDDVGTPSWTLIPYVQSRPKPGIWVLTGAEKDSFDRQMKEINQVIANAEALKDHWSSFVLDMSSQYLSVVAIPWRFLGRVLNKLGLTHAALKGRDLKSLHNCIRCESHRDLLISILDDINL